MHEIGRITQKITSMKFLNYPPSVSYLTNFNPIREQSKSSDFCMPFAGTRQWEFQCAAEKFNRVRLQEFKLIHSLRLHQCKECRDRIVSPPQEIRQLFQLSGCLIVCILPWGVFNKRRLNNNFR